jgi:uncharacterized membrane protein YkvA (DUF1232 family)
MSLLATALVVVPTSFPHPTGPPPLVPSTLLNWVGAGAAEAQDVGRYTRRLQKRAERSLGRFGMSLTMAALLWLWLIGSTGVFLLTSAVASVADVRMLDLRRGRLRLIGKDIRIGVRLFFRVLRDRRTPMLARLPLLAALAYWLLPVDLISDTPILPGFVDDLVIAIAGAKTFLYLCPDGVVTGHAQAVAAETQE